METDHPRTETGDRLLGVIATLAAELRRGGGDLPDVTRLRLPSPGPLHFSVNLACWTVAWTTLSSSTISQPVIIERICSKTEWPRVVI